MDFSEYYVVPAAYRSSVDALFEPIRISDHGKFVSVITDDRARFATVPVAMHFHNDEWSAWGFTVFVEGKPIARGLFGENAETGVTQEDNVLEGDLDEAARLLDVPAQQFHEALASEDVETFVRVVDVPLMSITPGVLARELGKDTMMKSLVDPASVSTKPSSRSPAVKKSAAKKSTAKKSAAKKSTARKSTAKKSTAKKSTAKKSTAKKAKKSTAKKSKPAQKSKPTAKKSGSKKR